MSCEVHHHPGPPRPWHWPPSARGSAARTAPFRAGDDSSSSFVPPLASRRARQVAELPPSPYSFIYTRSARPIRIRHPGRMSQISGLVRAAPPTSTPPAARGRGRGSVVPSSRPLVGILVSTGARRSRVSARRPLSAARGRQCCGTRARRAAYPPLVRRLWPHSPFSGDLVVCFRGKCCWTACCKSSENERPRNSGDNNFVLLTCLTCLIN